MSRNLATDPTLCRQRQTSAWIGGLAVITFLSLDVALAMGTEWLNELPLPFGSYRILVPSYAGAMMGLFSGQVLLAAGFAALGDGSSPLRLLYTTFMVAIFCNVLVLFGMWYFQKAWEDVVVFFLSPMFFYCVLQIPLWAFRSYRGWIIRSPWRDAGPQLRMRFTVAHLLGWSMFLAVPLCILPVLPSTFPPAAAATMAVIGLIACGLLLAAIRIFLATDFPWDARLGLFILGLLAGGVVQLIALHLSLASGLSTEDLLAMATANAGGCFVISVGLVTARALGYRLWRPCDVCPPGDDSAKGEEAPGQ